MKNMKMVKKIGRVIFVLPFLVFGAFHLMQAQNMAGLVPAMFTSILPGTVWVMLTGIVFLAAAIAILANKYTYWAAKILALQLLVFVLFVWLPKLGNPEMMQLAMGSLLKDIALIGGALMIAGMAGKPGMKHGCSCGHGACTDCKNCTDCKVDGGTSSDGHNHG